MEISLHLNTPLEIGSYQQAPPRGKIIGEDSAEALSIFFQTYFLVTGLATGILMRQLKYYINRGVNLTTDLHDLLSFLVIFSVIE